MEMQEVWAPGRVNLIGEHIDYHGLPVFPIALRRRVTVRFHARRDRRICAESAGYGRREFAWDEQLDPVARGDWENYLRAAARAVTLQWGCGAGVDATISADLPPAAGLSSSSALLVAFTLCLLAANRQRATFEELMAILPEAEHFVGTRGGGMDHGASLASREGCASLISFAPLNVDYVPVPDDWGFLVAHSLQAAEKSGAAREQYNARREAGFAALKRLGLESYRGARPEGADALTGHEHDAFLHTTTEARRVAEAVEAMRRRDARAFGQLLLASHASLRDRLHVSSPALDELVAAAMNSGACGARLTGAGFGGAIVAFAHKSHLPDLRRGLIDRFYRGRPNFRECDHLIDAEPGPGALPNSGTTMPH
jgi:galactokinase